MFPFSLRWNDARTNAVGEQADWASLWLAFHADMARIKCRAAEWRRQMLANGDLATNLLKFARSFPSVAAENKV